MSGGVDSSVAALLSRRAGQVVAVTLELWSDRENDGARSCCSASAVAQARALARSLDLPHFTLDLRPEFRAGVVDSFIAGYAAGETPNPCVSCNGHVRLDAMLAFADRLGCELLATGHYARTTDQDDDAGPLLRLAADPDKDQTYMLVALSLLSLARMSFPLGELTKPEVRRIAGGAGLSVASKQDSQDLCFLAGTDRGRFLARHGGLPQRPGEIVDARSPVLGRHRGQHLFTVGQRRGIGLDRGGPLYVLDKQATANRVVVGPRPALETRTVAVRGARLHRAARRVDRVKLRYRSAPLPARVVGDALAGAHSRLTIELLRAGRRRRARPARVPDGRREDRRLGDDRAEPLDCRAGCGSEPVRGCRWSSPPWCVPPQPAGGSSPGVTARGAGSGTRAPCTCRTHTPT